MKKEKKGNSFARLMDFAAPCRGKMVASVILAVLGVACSMVHYFAVANIERLHHRFAYGDICGYQRNTNEAYFKALQNANGLYDRNAVRKTAEHHRRLHGTS